MHSGHQYRYERDISQGEPVSELGPPWLRPSRAAGAQRLKLPSQMPSYSEVIETVVEAYRGREIAPIGGGFSLSQQNNFSCSQMLSQSHSSRAWITQSCRDSLEWIPASEVHMLIREV